MPKSSRKHTCDAKYAPHLLDENSSDSLDGEVDFKDHIAAHHDIALEGLGCHKAAHLAHSHICDVPTFTACLHEKLKKAKG